MRAFLSIIVRFLMLVIILEGQHVFAETPPDADLASHPPNPTEDIAWVGGMSGVVNIESAFNHARVVENEQLGTALPMLTLPAQEEWNRMSSGDKALWLINRERTDRGLLPLHGLEPNVTGVAQTYAQYLLDHQVWGHSEDGRTPPERIAANPTIGACQDSLRVSENLAYFASSNAVPLPLERAIYAWIYDDGDCCQWFHRRTVLWDAYDDNSGPQGQEGFLGIGHVTGPYLGWDHAHIIIMDVFDPCAAWEYATPPPSLSPPAGPVTVSVSGRVTDHEERGIQGVTIAIATDESKFGITDAEGDYTLRDVPAGSYTFILSSPDYTLSPSTFSMNVTKSTTVLNFERIHVTTLTSKVRMYVPYLTK